MRKFFLATFIFLVLFLRVVSANVVCGQVEGDEVSSPVWMNVLIYYDSNSADSIPCKINSEKKFCCSLEAIKSVSFEVNKKVFAEVFDSETGYVSEPVSLITNSEGFSVFPKLYMHKGITFNSNVPEILINENSFFLNVSLDRRYNNLKYSLNSSEGFFEENLCTNCEDYSSFINLSKGKNTLVLTAYGFQEIKSKFEIYSLDYLSVTRNFSCEKCRQVSEHEFVIPAGALANVTIFLNSSHNISGEIKDYFPAGFVLENSSLKKEYSETHNLIQLPFSGKQSIVSYEMHSPAGIFPKKYLFKSELYGNEIIDYARISRLSRWPFFLYLRELSEKNSSMSNFNKISPLEPLILFPENSGVELIAIYPKEQRRNAKAAVSFNKNSENEEKFNVFSSLSDLEIERLLIKLKAEKGKDISLFSENKKISLKKYKENENYSYYEAYINAKEFKINN